MNAVIDTNVWVSGLLSLSGTPSRILDAYLKRRFTLCICQLKIPPHGH